MNPLLTDYFNREKDAMSLYNATTQAAMSNMQTGGNPLAPRMTATPGGTMSLMPIQSPGGATMPMGAESAAMFGGLPFGGFRATGGPVRPGRAYVVGEQAPEIFVPDRPGQIVPLNNNPVNGRPSTFDGVPRSQFFAANAGKTGGSVPVYNDIRGAMAGQMPQMDPRSLGTGGQNFVGPMPLPSNQPNQRLLAAQRENAVMSQNQREMLQTSPMRPVPFASTPQAPRGLPMLPPNNGSRISQSPMNRPYAEMPGGGGSLANRPVRQIGRSANDPTRIAEQMRRRGDPRAIMQLGQMQMGQNFARERDAVNFQQQQTMFEQQQQAMDARDARNFEQGMTMYGMQQGAADARDARNFQQQRQIEAERFMAEQAAQEAARKRVPMMGQVPIPGTNYMGTYADGRYMGNVPMAKPPEPLSFQPVPGTNVMVPRGEGADRIPLMENRGTIEGPRPSADTMGPMPGMMDLRPLDQTPSAPRAPQVRRILIGNQEVDAQWNAQTNQWEPVAMAGGSATGAPTSASANDFAGQTKKGFLFQLAK